MAMYSDEERDNLALQELMKQGAMNTVQPGMEQLQGRAPQEPTATAQSASTLNAPTSIQAPVDPGTSGVRDAGVGNVGETSAPDQTKWNTDGYSAPKYTAKNAGGFMDGYNETKWNSADHQTPKYVVGRIMKEAAGGANNLADPEKRAAAIAKIQEAYPGTTYNGKDKITLPTGEVIDAFKGASAGEYGITWQPLTDRQGNPLPDAAQAVAGAGSPMDASRAGINSLIGTDMSTYQTLMQKLQGILGPEATDRQALMDLMMR